MFGNQSFQELQLFIPENNKNKYNKEPSKNVGDIGLNKCTRMFIKTRTKKKINRGIGK